MFSWRAGNALFQGLPENADAAIVSLGRVSLPTHRRKKIVASPA